MVITNEPGYYEEGNFGVRHENIYLCCRCDDDSLAPESSAEFLRFDAFTRSPIQTKIVMPELLSVEQLAWLNDYNASVREALLPVYEATPAERFEQWQVTKEQM